MAKILRSTDHPQFTNKNATLDVEEGDNNLIETQAEINEGRGLSAVKAYDNAKEYRLDEFVSHLFNIYKYISDVPASGIVPGTEAEKWVLSSMGEFLLDKNYVVVTTDEITALKAAGSLQKGRNYFIDDPTLFAARGYYLTVKASAVDKFGIKGLLTALNPDYQGVGVYTGVTDYVANLGVWKVTSGTLDYDTLVNTFVPGDTLTGGVSGATATVVSDAPGSGGVGTLTLTDIEGEFSDGEDISNGTSPQATALADGTVTYTFNPVLGSVVIWNGRHYKKKNSVPSSTAPDLDGTNYLLLDYSVVTGYITETDDITIDLLDPDTTAIGIPATYDTLIKSRKDSRDNMVHSPLLFQWGNDNVTGNIVKKGASMDCLNNLQTIENIEVVDATVTANMATNDLKDATFTGLTIDVSDVTVDHEKQGRVYFAEVDVSAAELAIVFGTPIEGVPALGVNKAIKVITDTTQSIHGAVTSAYVANTDLILITDTADEAQSEDSEALLSTASRVTNGTLQSATGTTNTQFVANKALMISTKVANPTVGDFPIKKFIMYYIINI